MSDEKTTSSKKAMRAKFKELTSGQFSFWKAPVASTTIRILPALPGQENFWIDTRVHYIGNKPFQCQGEGGCVACDFSEELIDHENPDRQAKGAKMRVQVQTAANIAVNHGTPQSENFVWTIPNSVMQDIISVYFGEYADLDHPVKGYDLVLTRTGTGMGTRYKVLPRKNTSRTTKQMMAGRKDLSKLQKVVSTEEIRSAISVFVKSKASV